MTDPTPAPTNDATAIAGLKEARALLTASARTLTNAVSKLGAAKTPQLAALSAEIAAQVALIATANGKLQTAASSTPAPAPAPTPVARS